jgi:hydroxyisourate hydrolase
MKQTSFERRRFLHLGFAACAGMALWRPARAQAQGEVTAHVLDAMTGKPAAGVVVELYDLGGEKPLKVAQTETNAQGRGDLIKDKPVPVGRYEMRFAIGDYFRKGSPPVAEPFFDVVPMRFFIAKPTESYHVPLIVTPYTYTVHG